MALVSLSSPVNRVQYGFTLLELIIAMTLLGFIAVMMASALQLGRRALDAGEQQAETTNRVRLVQSFLRRQLAQARPVQWQQAAGNQALVFEGKPHKLRFVAPPPARHVWGGLQLISLEAEHGDAGEQLILTYEMLIQQGEEAPRAEQRERVVLLDHMEALEFSYLGRRTPDEPLLWHNEWQSGYGLPRLVRLSAKMRDGRETAWPELVVALHGE